MTPYIIVGALIIVGLAVYAIYLQWQLHRQKKTRQAQAAELAEELESRREHYRKSIHVIAAAIEADQVTLTEGAIRISMLVTQLELDDVERDTYQVFFQLADATSHIPILDEWKKLSTREKLRFDRERAEIEDKYREFVVDAARRVLQKKGSETDQPLFYSVGKH